MNPGGTDRQHLAADLVGNVQDCDEGSLTEVAVPGPGKVNDQKAALVCPQTDHNVVVLDCQHLHCTELQSCLQVQEHGWLVFGCEVEAALDRYGETVLPGKKVAVCSGCSNLHDQSWHLDCNFQSFPQVLWSVHLVSDPHVQQGRAGHVAG